jgi:hypothetical protein
MARKGDEYDGDRQFEGHVEPDECRFDEPADDVRCEDSENALDDLFVGRGPCDRPSTIARPIDAAVPIAPATQSVRRLEPPTDDERI